MEASDKHQEERRGGAAHFLVSLETDLILSEPLEGKRGLLAILWDPTLFFASCVCGGCNDKIQARVGHVLLDFEMMQVYRYVTLSLCAGWKNG